MSAWAGNDAPSESHKEAAGKANQGEKDTPPLHPWARRILALSRAATGLEVDFHVLFSSLESLFTENCFVKVSENKELLHPRNKQTKQKLLCKEVNRLKET